MTTTRAPLCWDCKHFEGYDPDKDASVCAAFPDGIPRPIIDGEIEHREPFPGDRGIRFEPVQDAESA